MKEIPTHFNNNEKKTLKQDGAGIDFLVFKSIMIKLLEK